MSERAPYTSQQLLTELEPVAEDLFERHMKAAVEWSPHTMVPWERINDGKNPATEWDETEATLDRAVSDALYLNTLTEDKLPYYFRDIDRAFGRDGVWGEWNGRWTAEEVRHSIVMRDYILVTRALDPWKLEQARMTHLSSSEVPAPEDVLNGIVYVALQELATRVSHRNTGKLLPDEAGQNIMERVARDENLHHLFYRDLVKTALELDPSNTVIAIDNQVEHFAMPGTGVEEYRRMAVRIALAGIYGKTEFKEQIVDNMTNKHWLIWELEGLTAQAEQARENLATFLTNLGEAVEKEKQKRAARANS